MDVVRPVPNLCTRSARSVVFPVDEVIVYKSRGEQFVVTGFEIWAGFPKYFKYKIRVFAHLTVR